MSSEIEIRELHTNEEMKLVQKLDDTVWKGDSIPTHQTITAIKNGGIMVGAFLQEELVGFSYSFAGFLNGKSYLCSHSMGIHPDHRNKGIGSRLKAAQKKAAQEMGYHLITWTYDPLETRNGYLNLSKLRAICSTYEENCYGELDDGLNSGLPTDRFKVEWWINSEHVNGEPLNVPDAKHMFSWTLTDNGLPALANIDFTLHNEPVLVPVPANFQALKSQDSGLALDWRMKTRDIFQTLFGQGYTAVLLRKTSKEPVHYYVLVKKASINK